MRDWTHILRRLSQLAAALAMAVGCVALAGWALGSPSLAAFATGLPPVRPLSAVVLMLIAAAALLRHRDRPRARAVADVLALLGFVISLAALAANLAGRDLPTDALLFPGRLQAFLANQPRRVLLLTSVNLALVSAVVFATRFRALAAHAWQTVALLAGALAAADLLGFTFRAPYLYHVAGAPATSLPATLGEVLLVLSIFLLRPEEGWALRLVTRHAGGFTLRRMLPVVLLAPWLVGWATLRLGRVLNYPREFDHVLMTSFLTLLLLWLLWRNARSLDSIDALREAKMEELGALTRDLERRVFERTLELADSNTSLRRINRELEMLRRCNRAIVRASEEGQLLRSLCDLAVHAGGYVLAWVGFAQHDERKSVQVAAQAGPAGAYLDEIEVTWAEDDSRGCGPTGQAIRSGRPAVCHDTQEDSGFQAWREAAARHGIRSSIGLPLHSPGGEVIGAFMLYGPQPDGFDEREISLLQELAGDLAFGIAGLRSRRERDAAQLAVAAERQKFDTILNVLPPYILLLTPDYHVAFANREFRRRFGDSGGRRCFEFLFGRGEPCETCETFKVLKTAEPHQWEWTGPDGREYEVYDYPFVDTDGTRLILEMGIDRTERRHAEQEVLRLNNELEDHVRARTADLKAANEELEAFTYSVSHDLRAPLRHLDGFSRLLLEEYGPRLEPGATAQLERIRHAAVRLGHLIDDLLQFSRLGRQALRRQITGLAALVREVIDELAPECEGRDIEWQIRDLPFLECDPSLTKQVFFNLLSNALKYTRPRARAVIEIGQCRVGEEHALFVADNGVGFNMKYANKLFGVFQRLHRAEDFEGTGVGLATVKRIVQKHGGRIWPEAELDRGAKFLFTLSGDTQNGALPEPQLAAKGGTHVT